MHSAIELERLILKHKALYYQGRPEISDHEYDKLEDDLRAIDPTHPVLNLIGSMPKTNEKVAHDTKMLSLGKTYDIKELLSWKQDHSIVSAFKIDGVSCSLVYDKGVLVLAKTRGDGEFGEDITNKIRWVQSIPKKIKIKERCEVRGELFCREANFFQLSEDMVALGLEKPNSQRNIVAGIISRKDRNELALSIDFQAFDLLEEKITLKTEWEKINFLRKLGFETPDCEIHKDEKTISAVLDSAKDFIAEGDYLIDGVVFTFNEISLHQELGSTAHHPRYRMAFKFAGEAKVTKINSIEWSVSRNGTLTPVAEVEPVELSGAMISRVTLHNYGMVKQHNLKSGDQIEIVRSGEVIPKFLRVIESSAGEFQIPSRGCAECKSDLEVKDIRLVCINTICPAREREAILNFIQKMGIDDLSSKRLEELMRQGLVKTIPDLYRIQAEELLKIDKVKEKLAQKLIDNIEKSRSAKLATFLGALGLTGGAFNKCEKIVAAGYDTLDKIFALTVETLSTVEGFAERSASEILNSLQEKRPMIEELVAMGFVFEERKIVETPIKGKKICITGALSEKRTVIEQRIRNFGGIIVGSVSKNTDFLLSNEGDSGSSKSKKAQELGIPILNEQEFKSLLE